MTQTKHRQLVRWIKRILITGFLVAVVGLVVMAWMPKPVSVEIQEVARGELVVTVNEDGRTRVKDRYVVSSPLAGNLGRIELYAGDAVEQGAPLANLVPLAAPLLDARSRQQAQAREAAAQAGTQQARAQIQRARVALRAAKQEVERIEPLAERGVESVAAIERAQLDRRSRVAELASAEFAARVAEYELEMARSALGRMNDSEHGTEQLEVTSPIAGRVLKVIQQSEGVTQAGVPLLELGNPQALEIVVDVLTRDAVQIERGAPAVIDRWGGQPLKATVRLVEPSAFTRLSSLGVEEQRANVVLELDEPYENWQALGDGYRVEARITIWREAETVKVPSSALFRREQGWALFVVSHATAELRTVEIGRRNGLEAQVLSGVEPGERVILHPSDRVVEGVEVTWR